MELQKQENFFPCFSIKYTYTIQKFNYIILFHMLTFFIILFIYLFIKLFIILIILALTQTEC